MEQSDFEKEYFESLINEEKEELAKNEDLVLAFCDYMAGKGVVLSRDNFRFFRTTGIVAVYPNLISYLHPNLIADKEELFDFNYLCQNFRKKELTQGYLFGERFGLMAHTFFRRSFYELNHYALRFIEMFWNLKSREVEQYISLDKDRVRIDVDSYPYVELDTWYGAKFEKEISLISDGIVKLRPPLDLRKSLINFFFANAYSLDIKWATKGSIKSFQAEEIKYEDTKVLKDGKEYYPVRYIHAEFDIDKGYFRHFDGAIHFYNEDEYFARRDSDFNYNSKEASKIKSHSQKLYKMNGRVDVEMWLEYTNHFFAGNPLLFEYFEGSYPDHIIEMIEKVRVKES